MALIKLANIILNENMLWSDKNAYSPIEQQVVQTAGKPIIYSAQLQKGRPITLIASEDGGWFDYSMVQDLQQIANAHGTEYNLTIDTTVYRVIFRHHEPPAFDVKNKIPRLIDLDGDYFTGTLKLMTI